MDKEEQQQKPLDDEVLNNNIEDKSTDEIKVKTESEAKEKNQEKEITPEDKIRELEDKLARTFAEMENQRRRFEKEKEDAFEYGGTSFAKEALNLIDNLERSKQVLKNDDKLKNSEALISIFGKNDIKPIDCLNKKLDPNFHQAMMEIEDNQKEPGTIVQEIQKGFTIKNRLLRPSLVCVSKKIDVKDKKLTENKEKKENN